jgi:hypothetical protein
MRHFILLSLIAIFAMSNVVNAQGQGSGGGSQISCGYVYALADSNSVSVSNMAVTPAWWQIPITVQSAKPIVSMEITVNVPTEYANYAYLGIQNWDFCGWPEYTSYYDNQTGNVTFALANGYSFGGTINLSLQMSINTSDSLTVLPVSVVAVSFNDTIQVKKLTAGAITVYGQLLYGDVNGDGKVTTLDAAMVLGSLVGRDTLKTIQDSLSAETSGNHPYTSQDASNILQKVVDSNFCFQVQGCGGFGITTKKPISVIITPSGDGADVSVDPIETETINYGDLSISLPFGVSVSSSSFGGEMNQIGTKQLISFASQLQKGAVIHLSGKNAASASVVGKLNGRTVMPKVMSTLGVENNISTRPTKFMLEQNYPNPFNPTTKIAFDIPNAGHVVLAVYNVLGQKVATLVDGEVSVGHHEAIFNASNNPSGVYLYQLNAGGKMQVNKMILAK